MTPGGREEREREEHEGVEGERRGRREGRGGVSRIGGGEERERRGVCEGNERKVTHSEREKGGEGE